MHVLCVFYRCQKLVSRAIGSLLTTLSNYILLLIVTQASARWDIGSRYTWCWLWDEVLMWLVGVVECMLAARRVQLSVSAANGQLCTAVRLPLADHSCHKSDP